MSKVASTSQRVLSVGYLRRSTDRQETSIPEQTNAIQEYAEEKGYQIIRWYTDDAISGDDTENRHGFLQMLQDAQQKGDYQVIICWDQSRFGRFSPQEAGHWTYLFTKAGVGLVTIDKGPIDWNDFTGWLTYSVNQHSKHDFLIQLSKDVVRGQKEAAGKGSWLGHPPYGYCVEGTKKNKRLILDDPAKAKVVQRIFREYMEEGRSMADIARRLQDDKIVSPTGSVRGWRYDSVRCILENPAYAGDFVSGRMSRAKFHTLQGKKVTGARKHVKNPESQWIVRRDTHEAVIDREQFERARERLAQGKTGAPRFTPEANPFALNGLLRCGKCGCPMWGDTVKTRRFYRCSNWINNGVQACDGTKVSEAAALEEIGDHLVNWLGLDTDWVIDAAGAGELQPDDLPEAFEQVKKLVMPPAVPKKDRERLKKQVEKLIGDIAKARANLILLEPENIPAAQDKIRQMDYERAAIEEELKQSTPPAEKDVNAVTLEVVKSLFSLAATCWSLANGDSEGEPTQIRRLLNHASHVIIHSEKRGSGTSTRHDFRGGEIVFRGVGGNTSKVNLHNRAS